MPDPLRLSIESPGPHHDRFLASQPGGLIYYSSAYLGMLASLLDAEIRVVAVYSNDRLTCIMPFAVKSRLNITILNSLPFFGSHGGPLLDHTMLEGHKTNVLAALVQFLHDYCAENRVDSATMVTNPFGDAESAYMSNNLGFEFSLERVGQFNRLPEADTLSREAFVASVEDRRVRGSITKAIRSGVEVTRSEDWDDYTFLLETHEKTMSSKGVPHKDFDFFRYIYGTFPTEMRQLFVATLNGKKIGALLNLYYNGFVEYFVPVTADDSRVYQPASLLIFESMRQAILDNYKVWNWGGSGDGTGGVYDFKKKWGAEETRYLYLNRIYKSAAPLEAPEVRDAFRYFFVFPFKRT